ncbi:unnamed protein product [Microthlaspi erraticum]|uniref:Retrotransposon gag domain-containing protein n=1 Tax=Microthlaspi erraticum TaxID=1685480 RepID=A0A6D2JPM6_9BRAS|nr:unnamed protein product [Microthlaspi erraticum]CAA7056757.1 unnamed protein product [Microthlaspi erraticum]
MGSNKERIEGLEANLGELQDELQKLGQGMIDKFQSMEAMMKKIAESMGNNKDGESSAPPSARRNVGSHHHDPNNRADTIHTNPVYQARSVKLVFPRFSGGDPTSWLSKVKQYFAYNDTPSDERVSYASYHLEDEANEWWQAISKALKEDNVYISWLVFEEELWARFGPTDGDNFDEALSKIQQTGTLREYQREFERLQNNVDGWTQKALVGTFLGGLNPSIADPIRMFKPQSLKDVIGLARMRDDQLQKQRKGSSFSNLASRNFAPTPTCDASLTPKKLSWDEIKRKRSLGL